MQNITKFPDTMCVEVGDMKQCMDGEVLLAAILIECCFYFICFVFGVKAIDFIRRKIKGEKNVKLRQREVFKE
jgi:flagellar biosynthesis protein FlhB